MKSLALSLLIICACLQAPLASAPVRKTIIGCVSNGVFTSENGYIIKLRQLSGAPLNLSRWQNQRLQVTGNLLPGDIFFIVDAPIGRGRCP